MTDYHNHHHDKDYLMPRRGILWLFVIVAISLPIIASIALNYEQISFVIISYVQSIIPDNLWFIHDTHKYIGSI